MDILSLSRAVLAIVFSLSLCSTPAAKTRGALDLITAALHVSPSGRTLSEGLNFWVLDKIQILDKLAPIAPRIVAASNRCSV